MAKLTSHVEDGSLQAKARALQGFSKEFTPRPAQRSSPLPKPISIDLLTQEEDTTIDEAPSVGSVEAGISLDGSLSCAWVSSISSHYLLVLRKPPGIKLIPVVSDSGTRVDFNWTCPPPTINEITSKNIKLSKELKAELYSKMRPIEQSLRVTFKTPIKKNPAKWTTFTSNNEDQVSSVFFFPLKEETKEIELHF